MTSQKPKLIKVYEKDTAKACKKLRVEVDQKSNKPLINTTGKEKPALVTPFYNMGVTVSDSSKQQLTRDEVARLYDTKYPRQLDNVKIIKTDDGTKQVLHAIPSQNEVASHDWVTFSIGIETFSQKYLMIPNESKDYVFDDIVLDTFSQDLFEIFGFCVGSKRDRGMHFYSHSYELQDNLGLVLIGHKSNKISVQVNGTGCALAANGWQQRLYRYLTEYAQRPAITRVDLCVDDFDGKYPLEWADEKETLGEFWCGGRYPKVQHYGNWKYPDGAGRTLMIGNRENGKCLRAYEKGKKEGDPLSLWNRYEVEFKSVDRHIPLDILLAPTQYYIAAYPVLMVFNDHHQPEKIATVQKLASISVQKSKEILKHQYGKYISFFKKIYSDSEIISFLMADDEDALPKRLQICGQFSASVERNKQLANAFAYTKFSQAMQRSEYCAVYS